MGLLAAYENSPVTSHVPYSVACLLHGLVDMIVHNAGDSRDVQLQGWARREANVRPGNKFDDDVRDVLREYFDKKTRMNQYAIQKHLISRFGQYSAKVLRPAQISGWVGAEVGRRRKAVMVAACDAVSVGAVEADEVQGAGIEEGVEIRVTNMQEAKDECSCSNSKLVPLTAAGTQRLQGLKTAWRSRRPCIAPSKPVVAKRKPTAFPGNGSAPQKRHKSIEISITTKMRQRPERPEKVEAEPAPTGGGNPEARKILSVVSKRGRRCEWEYECRWLGVIADQTTWEPCDRLAWPSAQTAIKAYEQKMRSQKARNILGAALSEKPWVRSKCCNSVVNPETCDSRDRCLPLDNAACIGRQLNSLPSRRSVRSAM